MNPIAVDPSKCNNCRTCLETCPVFAIGIDGDGRPSIADDDKKRCVLCGHCEAACPTGALRHAELPESRPIRREVLRTIEPENLSEYFRCRRSIRNYHQRPVERAKLEQVLEVVGHSPTGVNLQANKWVVVTEPDRVRRLGEATVAWMRAMLEAKSPLAEALGFEGLVVDHEAGKGVVCRGAPCLVIGYTDASHTGGALDSLIATAHLDLLLPAFGLGGCWAGYVMIAMGMSPDVRALVGLGDAHAVRSALMIGYPKHRMARVPPRKPAQVAWL